jgi:hypothetical protein
MLFVVKPGKAFRTSFVIAFVSCNAKAVKNKEHGRHGNKGYQASDLVAMEMRCQQKYKANNNGRQATDESISKKNNSGSGGWFLAFDPGDIFFVSVFLSAKQDSDLSDDFVGRVYVSTCFLKFILRMVI